MSNIIDRINAPAARKAEAGKAYLIKGISFAMVDDTMNGRNEKRPQVIINTEDDCIYAPSNVCRAVKEFIDKGLTIDDIEAELAGHVMKVSEVYSNKWRRMILTGEVT